MSDINKLELRNKDLEVLRFLADYEYDLIDSGNLLSLPDMEYNDIDVLTRLGLIETCDLDIHYYITDFGRQALRTGEIDVKITFDEHQPNRGTIEVVT